MLSKVSVLNNTTDKCTTNQHIYDFLTQQQGFLLRSRCPSQLSETGFDVNHHQADFKWAHEAVILWPPGHYNNTFLVYCL